MSRTERVVQAGLAALLLLHAVSLAVPATLWSLSALAVWPRPWAVAWTGAALLACFAAPFLAARLRLPAYPGRRGAALLSLAAAVAFWLLRQRTHFSGDGFLLVRDRGWSETVTRARLLVECTTRTVHAAESSFGWSAERTLALLSVASGVAGTYALFRFAASLTPERDGRWLVACLLLGGTCMQLFFGHVEYYPMVAAALLVYLALVARTCSARFTSGTLVSLAAFGALLSFHLSTLALAPAVGWLAWRAWRLGHRKAVGIGVAAIPLLAALLVLVASGRPGSLLTTSVGGWTRYTAAYFEPTSARHAFPFFSLAHALAVGNDILRAAPLALLGPLMFLFLRQQRPGAVPALEFLLLAATGVLLTNSVFLRELGPYRDWDIFAPFGFVLLGCTGALLLAAGAATRVTIVLVLIGSVHSLLPWILTLASPKAAVAHVHRALEAESQWSPHARAYMHEELAIWQRQRGDAALALQEYEAAVRANPADARYHVGLANQYAERGEMAAAAREYALALERRPDYAPAHNNLAYVLAQQGQDLDRAREHARRALALEPENPDYLLTLARIEVAAGRPLVARAALQQALERRRVFPEAEKLLRSLPP
ncbi:MAG TPA: tetratricopeptide repeat protein [Candidatus Krumholzibacteria bacterium]|nr:tetratricopeptide repeat protein [Candidatus Krumholzibacteria bacterium]